MKENHRLFLQDNTVSHEYFSDLFTRITISLRELQPIVENHDEEERMKEILPPLDRMQAMILNHEPLRPQEFKKFVQHSWEEERNNATMMRKSRQKPLALNQKQCDSARSTPTNHPSHANDTNTTYSHSIVGGKQRALHLSDLTRIKNLMMRKSSAISNQKNFRPSRIGNKSRHNIPRDSHSQYCSSPASSSSHSSSPIARRISSKLRALSRPQSTDTRAMSFKLSSKQALIAELVAQTKFTRQHIFQISQKFRDLSTPKNTIGFEDFKRPMSEHFGDLFKNMDDLNLPSMNVSSIASTISVSDTFLRRLYLAFDHDADNKVDFREFMMGLNAFVHGTMGEKVDTLFELYGCRQKGTLSILDLLGLFQGDQQQYHQLMRCVDEYFARVKMRDDNTILQDEFISISQLEPHLLQRISAPISSKRYMNGNVRDIVRDFIACKHLDWEALVHIQKSCQSFLENDPSKDTIAAADFYEVLVENLDTSDNETKEELTKRILLAYVVRKPRSVNSTPSMRRIGSEINPNMIEEEEDEEEEEEDQDHVDDNEFEKKSLHGRESETQITIRASIKRSFLAVASSSIQEDLEEEEDEEGTSDRLETVSEKQEEEKETQTAKESDEPSIHRVSWVEFIQDVAACLQTFLLVESDVKWKAQYYFQIYDNGDGVLTKDELCAAVSAGFAHFGQNVMEVVRVLEAADSDHDGEITRDEYIRAAHKSPLVLASLQTCPHLKNPAIK